MELIRKDIDFEIKAVGDPDERTLEFIGSTADVDRYGDVIEVEGWELKNYTKNPVFLWAHDYREPPVGKAVKVEKADNGLMFQIKFPTAEEYAFADTVYKLYLGGYLQATSVGFRDLEREPILDKDGRQTGFRYKKQELYELSAVPVPANPQAIMMAVQKGIITEREADLFKEQPEGTNLLEKLAALEARVAELEAREGPPWVKTFIETQNMLTEVLAKAFGGKPLAEQDLYKTLLNPGMMPEGGQPSGEAAEPFSQVLSLAKNLNGLFKPRGV